VQNIVLESEKVLNEIAYIFEKKGVFLSLEINAFRHETIPWRIKVLKIIEEFKEKSFPTEEISNRLNEIIKFFKHMENLDTALYYKDKGSFVPANFTIILLTFLEEIQSYETKTP